jgi:hypothetical protein
MHCHLQQPAGVPEAMERMRRGLLGHWSRTVLVYGWLASEALQKARVTAVSDHIFVDLLSAHMSKFGHILRAKRRHGEYVPMAYDGVVHLKIQLLQGRPCFPTSWPSEKGGGLLNVACVSSDLHNMACFRCSQLAHLERFCRLNRARVLPLWVRGGGASPGI